MTTDLTALANGLDRRSDFQKFVDKEVLARVKAGMKLLQEQYGDDWVEHIDPATFDMAQGERCVLGQVCRLDPDFAKTDDYYESPYNWASSKWDINPTSYGFDTDRESYEELQWAWLRVFEEAGVEGAGEAALVLRGSLSEK